MKALVIGVSSYDTLIYINGFPDLKDDMAIFANKTNYSVGGTGAGKALALATLGVETTLVTDLGDDEAKLKILDFLDIDNLNLKVLSADKSTTHTNIMYEKDKRISIFTSIPEKVKYDASAEKDIIESDCVFLNINDYCRMYIPLIKKHKKLTIVDIHDYDELNPYHAEFIDAADILFASGVNIKDHELFLKKMIVGKEAVIITKSSRGSIAIDKEGKIYHQKAYKLDYIIDSNGAGDSYSAGYVFEFFRSKSIDKAMKYGSICGAIACQSNLLYNPLGTSSYIDRIFYRH
jgi:sugar/nucleoside kinase (ribokinase family)